MKRNAKSKKRIQSRDSLKLLHASCVCVSVCVRLSKKSPPMWNISIYKPYYILYSVISITEFVLLMSINKVSLCYFRVLHFLEDFVLFIITALNMYVYCKRFKFYRYRYYYCDMENIRHIPATLSQIYVL